MATFRAGQRVRIVRARISTWLIGKEGTVVPHDGLPGQSGAMFDYDVVIDGFGRHTCNAGALEPIQPEGNQAIAWSECLWQPEHLRERA